MLRGHVDAITDAGFIEGWALDDERPLDPLLLIVAVADRTVAHGIANRYRWDLAEAELGTGWCAFRLALSVDSDQFDGKAISLREAGTGTVIWSGNAVSRVHDEEANPVNAEQLTRQDPTVIENIQQLKACRLVFSAFIAALGIDAFIRTACLYALGRAPTPDELTRYRPLLEAGPATPFDVMTALHDGRAEHDHPGVLLAPTEPGFAFRVT